MHAWNTVVRALFAVVWKRYRGRVNSLEFRVELLKMEVSGWAIIRFLLSPASSCPLHTTTAYHRERHHFETSSIAPCPWLSPRTTTLLLHADIPLGYDPAINIVSYQATVIEQ